MRFSETKNISPAQIDELRAAVGWRTRGQKWKKILKRSSYVISAWDGKRLVGFGRLVEDGIMCMFYDLMVHPDYRHKGVGTALLEKRINKVRGKKYASIGLFAEEGKPHLVKLYEKVGFRKSTGMELKKHMR